MSANRRIIHQRWEALLRLERADTPIADPDNLVHMIDWTLDKVLAGLRSPRAIRGGSPPPTIAALRAECFCGLNPFFKHFISGEQALLEALVLAQADERSPDPAQLTAAVRELHSVTHEFARREVGAFCSLCQHRPHPKARPPAASVTAGN
jgi:hypothetical protein